MRHLKQNARAVAGVLLATTRAAVIEVLQNLQTLLDDRVGLLPLDVRDEADAAGIVLKTRIVEALLRGQIQQLFGADFTRLRVNRHVVRQ